MRERHTHTERRERKRERDREIERERERERENHRDHSSSVRVIRHALERPLASAAASARRPPKKLYADCIAITGPRD